MLHSNARNSKHALDIRLKNFIVFIEKENALVGN